MQLYRNLLAIIPFCLLFTFQALGKSIEVCPDCTIKSIKEGIRTADAYDTLLIGNGVYDENEINVNKPITVIGQAESIIDGGGDRTIMVITSDSVNIFGITFRNVQANYLKEISGIRVRKSAHFTISGNRFKNTFFAIYLEHSNNGAVTRNLMHGEAVEEASSGNAIHAWYCKNLYIEGNEAFGHRDGIYFEFVDSSEITNNYMHNNLRYGLHFMFSNNDVYHDNTFENNGAGVAVMFSNYIVMKQNTFVRNRGMASYGLLLKEISDGEIYQNVFKENTVGIFVEGSNRINYNQNTLIENGWAIKVSGGCIENNIVDNNFIGNSFDMTFAGKISSNSIKHNYWSAYSGYDLDRDGFGDVPYRPVKLFNYVVQNTPEAIVLLKSLFVDIINFSESVSPIFTPKEVFDPQPRMLPLETKTFD